MIYILVLLTLAAVVWLLLNNQPSAGVSVDYSTVRRLFVEEDVESFNIKGSTLTIKLKEPYKDSGSAIVTHELYDVAIFYEDMRPYIDKMFMEDENFTYNYDAGWQAPWWLGFIPYAVIIVVFVILWMAMMNRSGIGGDKSVMRFGKARTRLASEEKRRVTFADVAGADEEKEELQEIVDFLKGPQKYMALGARIPKGVLLVGPPGTGKTLMAKAVAGEAGVQFLSISGSDFVELYVGVGASRVRDLFDQAKKLAPAIIFIDEIDAVGRQRGAGLGGGHDEREQTLNQLLVEMDGFTTNEGVIVMAATNRADILDNALLRPGRFDRQIYVGLPDIKGREEILKVHARGKSIGDDVDFKSIARGTAGFTGADLENLLNEAALLAARAGKRFITMSEIEKATLKVLAGPEKKSRVVTEKDRRLTAYHEAGHAVIAELSRPGAVSSITIMSRGNALGYIRQSPAGDRYLQTRDELLSAVQVCVAGAVSEELFMGQRSTGAVGDIRQATDLAKQMVYAGLSPLGIVGAELPQAVLHEAVTEIIRAQEQAVRLLLEEYRAEVQAVAEQLLRCDSIAGDQFRSVLAKRAS